MQRLGTALCLAAALSVSAVVFVASDAQISELPSTPDEIVVGLNGAVGAPVQWNRPSVQARAMAASLTRDDAPLTMGVVERRMASTRVAANNDPASIAVP